MVQWLALLPHSTKVLDLIVWIVQGPSVCVFLLFMHGFSPGTPAYSHSEKTCIWLTSYSKLLKDIHKIHWLVVQE